MYLQIAIDLLKTFDLLILTIQNRIPMMPRDLYGEKKNVQTWYSPQLL